MSRLARMTWPEVARRTGPEDILLVPVGSTEQHGPHLPVSTDTDIAEAVTEGAAERDAHLVVAPALPYGSSGEHQGFAGTLSIGQDATELVLVELGRSATVDFAQVILVSTHGGNSTPVARAVARLRTEGHPVAAWSPAWGGDLHAGGSESSLMLAIDPARVRTELAAAGDLRPLDDLLPLLRSGGVRSVSANGVLGDPTGADPAAGRRLLDAAIGDLVEFAAHRRAVSSMEVTR
ncbi:MAG TPA: mycofactocin biosynthesis peptidyl-dipeptidase MftE [Acidimicrobiales bacterium]